MTREAAGEAGGIPRCGGPATGIVLLVLAIALAPHTDAGQAAKKLGCPADADGDQVCDEVDNCPLVTNPDQRDSLPKSVISSGHDVDQLVLYDVDLDGDLDIVTVDTSLDWYENLGRRTLRPPDPRHRTLR